MQVATIPSILSKYALSVIYENQILSNRLHVSLDLQGLFSFDLLINFSSILCWSCRGRAQFARSETLLLLGNFMKISEITQFKIHYFRIILFINLQTEQISRYLQIINKLNVGNSLFFMRSFQKFPPNFHRYYKMTATWH